MKRELLIIMCTALYAIIWNTGYCAETINQQTHQAIATKGKHKPQTPTKNSVAPTKSAATGTAEKPKSGENIYTRLQSKADKEEGFFTLYHIDDKYYFEIPDSLSGREMLLITRRQQTAMDMGFGGETLDQRILSWERRDNKYVYLRANSYRKIAAPGSSMHEAVRTNMMPSIIAALPIKGFSHDSTSVIVEVTDLFRKDDLAFGLNYNKKKQYTLGGLDDHSSYIVQMHCYPTNIETTSVKTYALNGTSSAIEDDGLRSVTLELHNSLVLLPRHPMRPRYGDERVGFFSQRQWDFSDDQAQKAVRSSFVKRWRLEPADPAAYFAGQMVEPVKPIVLYLSPAIPQQWVKYFKAGVEDWQAAFEKAGFKNAIQARPYPSKEENPEFDPFDARYSIVEYFASQVENSYGPHIADPRSGEIVQTHVCIYHNVLKLLHDWYLLQCGATDPAARKPVYDEALMGRLLRYLVCHEVGHTLGLAHNFGASSAYPVDSLRSATFTREHGTTASIMDYARFNYIAQPEDKGVYMFPKVGEYDKFAIEWAYRVLPGTTTPEEERLPLNEFVKEQQKSPYCRYIQQLSIPSDPRGQAEDLGDDPIKAAAYGLKNLQTAVEHLNEWTAREGYSNRDLQELYGKAQQQWSRYMSHVTACVGGIYEDYKTADQQGDVYTVVEKAKQQAAVKFLAKNAFCTPMWLVNPPYIGRFDLSMSNTRKVQEIQATIIRRLLNTGVLIRMEEHYALHPDGYNPEDYLKEVRSSIWKELYGNGQSDMYLRVLQRTYLSYCEDLLGWHSKGQSSLDLANTEYKTRLRTDLQELLRTLKARAATGNGELRQHYRESAERIEQMLKPQAREENKK